MLSVLRELPSDRLAAIRRHTVPLGDRGGSGRRTYDLPDSALLAGLARACSVSIGFISLLSSDRLNLLSREVHPKISGLMPSWDGQR